MPSAAVKQAHTKLSDRSAVRVGNGVRSQGRKTQHTIPENSVNAAKPEKRAATKKCSHVVGLSQTGFGVWAKMDDSVTFAARASTTTSVAAQNRPIRRSPFALPDIAAKPGSLSRQTLSKATTINEFSVTKSHTSGEAKFGNNIRSLGNGMSQ